MISLNLVKTTHNVLPISECFWSFYAVLKKNCSFLQQLHH